MKKTVNVSLLILLVSVLFSCKNTPEKKEVVEEKMVETGYIFNQDSTTISFTAYKTSAKTAVKGYFNEIVVENATYGTTQKEAINGLEFKIPVSSIFTKDTIRDGKIAKFFFGVMKNTELLSGKVSMDTDSTGSVDLLMNGISKNIPITISTNESMMHFEGILNVNDWEGGEALKSLNTVCFELHKGPDGVSKTWEDVKIEIDTKLDYK